MKNKATPTTAPLYLPPWYVLACTSHYNYPLPLIQHGSTVFVSTTHSFNELVAALMETVTSEWCPHIGNMTRVYCARFAKQFMSLFQLDAATQLNTHIFTDRTHPYYALHMPDKGLCRRHNCNNTHLQPSYKHIELVHRQCHNIK
jgi:hypothetical protein